MDTEELQVKIQELEESVDCLTRINDFLTGAREKNIVLAAALKETKYQLDVEQAKVKVLEGLLDMWLWETVNARQEHVDARRRTQQYFKEQALSGIKEN